MLKKLAILVLGLMMAILPAQAGEFGTKDEAIAMVKAVQAAFAKDGADATFKAVTEKKYVDRDLYPFIYDMNGQCLAHGANAGLVGKSLIDLKDQNGKMLIREIIATGKAGSGWVDFMWPNPVTKKVEAKASYVEMLGSQYVIGVGVYRP